MRDFICAFYAKQLTIFFLHEHGTYVVHTIRGRLKLYNNNNDNNVHTMNEYNGKNERDIK